MGCLCFHQVPGACSTYMFNLMFYLSQSDLVLNITSLQHLLSLNLNQKVLNMNLNRLVRDSVLNSVNLSVFECVNSVSQLVVFFI